MTLTLPELESVKQPGYVVERLATYDLTRAAWEEFVSGEQSRRIATSTQAKPFLSVTTSVVKKSNHSLVFITSWGEGRHAMVYRHAKSAMETHELQAQPTTSRLGALLAYVDHDALQDGTL